MFPPSSSLSNVQSFLFSVGSDAEAFSTAAQPLDVGVVEYELAGQLCLHKVHLGPEQGQLSFLLDEHPHTSEKETPVIPAVFSQHHFSICRPFSKITEMLLNLLLSGLCRDLCPLRSQIYTAQTSSSTSDHINKNQRAHIHVQHRIQNLMQVFLFFSSIKLITEHFIREGYEKVCHCLLSNLKSFFVSPSCRTSSSDLCFSLV